MKPTLSLKPPATLKTKSRRFKDKPVTIAAGFNLQDGIVMCADSQESAGDYKFPVEKMSIRRDPWTEVVIAGSGLGPLVDMASGRIIHDVMGGYDDYSVVEMRIGNVLNALYETEFRLFPTAQEDTTIDLLIAVKLKKLKFPVLYRSCATAISRVEEYAIIGSGRAVQYQVQNLYGRYMPIGRGILLAVQLLNVAKQVLSSVGGRGKIATLHAGDELGIGEAMSWEVSGLEKGFQRLAMMCGSLSMSVVDLGISDEELRKQVGDFERHLWELRVEHRSNVDAWKQLMNRLASPQKQSDSETSKDQQ